MHNPLAHQLAIREETVGGLWVAGLSYRRPDGKGWLSLSATEDWWCCAGIVCLLVHLLTILLQGPPFIHAKATTTQEPRHKTDRQRFNGHFSK